MLVYRIQGFSDKPLERQGEPWLPGQLHPDVRTLPPVARPLTPVLPPAHRRFLLCTASEQQNHTTECTAADLSQTSRPSAPTTREALPCSGSSPRIPGQEIVGQPRSSTFSAPIHSGHGGGSSKNKEGPCGEEDKASEQQKRSKEKESLA